MTEVTRYKWGEPIGSFEGTPIYGGYCVGGLPAVYMTRTEITHERAPENEEEWELYGHKLPDEITIMADNMVECVAFQALIAAGIAVEDCAKCPLRQNSTKT